MFDNKPPAETNESHSLEVQLRQTNELLSAMVKWQSNPWNRLKMGILTGVGTVVGATLVVSLLVLLVKPLQNVSWVGPVVKEIVRELESRKVR
jgi:hypothetical protein